jgi:ATP-dependent DNA helicase RecG
MTEAELRAIVALREADRIELTVSTKDSAKFSEAVCAFANDLPGRRQPGYLLIGVRDDGSMSGLRVDDELLRSLAGLREDGNIQPLPSLTVERVQTTDGDVAVVQVQPSDLPPVRYRGRTCIRIGPRKGYATPDEERRLIERRVSHARTFDAQPCLDAALQDLSQSLFLIDYRQQALAPEVIAENQRSIEQQLASLRFFDLSRNRPTHAGVILFALDVRQWLPGAYIQFLRVQGTTLAGSVVNDRVLAGDLLTNLRDLDAIVQAESAAFPVGETTLRERTVESFPLVAVRELLMNAVMHRDYASTAPTRVTWFEDRIEIQSPGGLYGEATAANFPDQTSYRNPVVAEAMKTLGYVNRYGRGVIRAREALRQNGSAPAEFRFDDGYVLALIPRRP